jgi:hypothetical protein
VSTPRHSRLLRRDCVDLRSAVTQYPISGVPGPGLWWHTFSLPYEVQGFPWSGLAFCARASASGI